MNTKKSNWKQSREYKRILEILDEYWLSQPEEESVEVEINCRHRNGNIQQKTIKWRNPKYIKEGSLQSIIDRVVTMDQVEEA